MPWKDLRPMDERVLFVADYVRELYSFSELCSRYVVSRKTGYKWIERYRREGAEGLEERSRRPLSQPAQLPREYRPGTRYLVNFPTSSRAARLASRGAPTAENQ